MKKKITYILFLVAVIGICAVIGLSLPINNAAAANQLRGNELFSNETLIGNPNYTQKSYEVDANGVSFNITTQGIYQNNVGINWRYTNKVPMDNFTIKFKITSFSTANTNNGISFYLRNTAVGTTAYTRLRVYFDTLYSQWRYAVYYTTQASSTEVLRSQVTLSSITQNNYINYEYTLNVQAQANGFHRYGIEWYNTDTDNSLSTYIGGATSYYDDGLGKFAYLNVGTTSSGYQAYVTNFSLMNLCGQDLRGVYVDGRYVVEDNTNPVMVNKSTATLNYNVEYSHLAANRLVRFDFEMYDLLTANLNNLLYTATVSIDDKKETTINLINNLGAVEYQVGEKQYGVHRLVFTARDGSGLVETLSGITITVRDTIKPLVTGTIPTTTIGYQNYITLPDPSTMTCSDASTNNPLELKRSIEIYNSSGVLLSTGPFLYASNKDYYTAKYTATDESGNKGELDFRINVADRDAPIFTNLGSFVFPSMAKVGDTVSIPTIYNNASDAYSEKSALTFNIECYKVTQTGSSKIEDTSIFSKNADVTKESEFNPVDHGEYRFVYTVADEANNIATFTMMLTCINLAGPTITVDEQSMSLFGVLNSTFTIPNATAKDALDTSVAVTVKVTCLGVNVTVTGTTTKTFLMDKYEPYILTYTAVDVTGLTTTKSYEIKCIVEENPVITLPTVQTEFNAGASSNIVIPNATSKDYFDEELTTTMVITGPNGFTRQTSGESIAFTVTSASGVGTYTVVYTAIDSYGNLTNQTLRFNVAAKSPPTLQNLPSALPNGTAGREYTVDMSSISALDMFGDAATIVCYIYHKGVLISQTGIFNPQKVSEYNSDFYIVFAAVDKYGNSAQSENLYMLISDDVAPEIIITDEMRSIPIAKEGGETVTVPKTTAIDDIATNVDVVVTVFNPNNQPVTLVENADDFSFVLSMKGEYRVVYTADDGINTSSIEFVINSVEGYPMFDNIEMMLQDLKNYEEEGLTGGLYSITMLTAETVFNKNIKVLLSIIGPDGTSVNYTLIEVDNPLVANEKIVQFQFIPPLRGIYTLRFTCQNSSGVTNSYEAFFRIKSTSEATWTAYPSLAIVELNYQEKNPGYSLRNFPSEGDSLLIDLPTLYASTIINNASVVLDVYIRIYGPGTEGAYGEYFVVIPPTGRREFTATKIGWYTIVYTCTDIFGNTSFKQFRIEVVATRAPTFLETQMLEEAMPKNASAKEKIVLPMPTVFDNTDPNPLITVLVTGPNGFTSTDFVFTPGIEGEYEVTYTSVNSSGMASELKLSLSVAKEIPEPTPIIPIAAGSLAGMALAATIIFIFVTKKPFKMN